MHNKHMRMSAYTHKDWQCSQNNYIRLYVHSKKNLQSWNCVIYKQGFVIPQYI